jgi:E3 ubiquitin-protein ligase HUWE1
VYEVLKDFILYFYRYNPGQNLVVSASKKVKVGRELQLPSMTALTSKTSSQQFFLRILKVIIQLREAARSVGKKTPSNRGRIGGRGIIYIYI